MFPRFYFIHPYTFWNPIIRLFLIHRLDMKRYNPQTGKFDVPSVRAYALALRIQILEINIKPAHCGYQKRG